MLDFVLGPHKIIPRFLAGLIPSATLLTLAYRRFPRTGLLQTCCSMWELQLGLFKNISTNTQKKPHVQSDHTHPPFLSFSIVSYAASVRWRWSWTWLHEPRMLCGSLTTCSTARWRRSSSRRPRRTALCLKEGRMRRWGMGRGEDNWHREAEMNASCVRGKRRYIKQGASTKKKERL